MAGNLCRCGTYPKIEEAIARGETDPHGEGSRGPLRGGLARGRGGCARTVARRPARVVGRPAPRSTGRSACAARRPTPPTSGLPGMLHAAVLRWPHARATVARMELAPARVAPGVVGRRPGDAEALTASRVTWAWRSPPSAPTRASRPGAVALVAVEWDVLSRCSTPTRRSHAAIISDARAGNAATSSRPRRAGRRRRGDVPHTDRVAQLMESHGSVCAWVSDTLEVYTSTQVIWGVRAALARQLGCPRTTCGSSASSWAAASAPRTTRATTRSIAAAFARAPAGPCAARSRAARRTSRG